MPNPRKPARTGGMADLAAGDPNEIKEDLKREVPQPQGAGGMDVADDADEKAKKRTKQRAARVLR